MNQQTPLQSQKTATPISPANTSLLQRKCACGQFSGGGECTVCKKKRMSLQRYTAPPSSSQRESWSEGQYAPPIVHEVLRSPGQPLDPVTRTLMEPRFGHDFSSVRVHTDAKATESARAVNALAYTVGQDVIFGGRRYAPHTHEGRRLIAHELTHVTQQRGLDNKLSRLSIGTAHDQYEQEADRVTKQVMLGNAVTEFPIRCESLVQRTIGDGHDLTAPWLAGDAVLEAIYDNERLMRNGSRGTAVKKVQQLLFYLGIDFPAHGADGIFGSETETAVKEFQRAHVDEAGVQLVDDGIVGPLTMGALNREANQTGTNIGNLIRTAPISALHGPPTALPVSLSIDRIDIVDSAGGAIGGYPAIVGNADLNNPGPFNDAATGETKNVHQIHFHLDNGNSASLSPRRELQRSAFRAGRENKNPADQPLPAGVAGPPTPGGFDGILVGPDGPPAHEIQRPTADTIVIADAPGSRSTPPTDYPYIYRSHFTLTVEDISGAPIARIKYDVRIERKNAGDIPNTENQIFATERKDFVRGRNL